MSGATTKHTIDKGHTRGAVGVCERVPIAEVSNGGGTDDGTVQFSLSKKSGKKASEQIYPGYLSDFPSLSLTEVERYFARRIEGLIGHTSLRFMGKMLSIYFPGPPQNESEQIASAWLLNRLPSGLDHYHGGPSLPVKTRLRPEFSTSCLTRVYTTFSIEKARNYAARHNNGKVYRVDDLDGLAVPRSLLLTASAFLNGEVGFAEFPTELHQFTSEFVSRSAVIREVF